MSRLVKKIKYGERITIDFSNTEMKIATVYMERDFHTVNGLKMVIEADVSIPISGIKTS